MNMKMGDKSGYYGMKMGNKAGYGGEKKFNMNVGNKSSSTSSSGKMGSDKGMKSNKY